MREGVYIFIILIVVFIPILARAQTNNIPIPVLELGYQVEVGEVINLSASQTLDIDGDDLAFVWDFGDGVQVTGDVVQHSYAVVGRYNVYLSVIDGSDISVVSFVIEVVEQTSNIINNNSGGSSVNQVSNYSQQIIINELMPNPAGSDDFEWIELFNSGSADTDLNNWALRDASGKKYFINTDDFISTIIPAHDYFVIPRAISGLALNNNGETLELLNTDLSIISTTEYDSAAGDDIAWAIDNTNQWQWTQVATKGEKNIIKTIIAEVQNLNQNLVSDVVSQFSTSTNIEIIENTYATSGDVVISEILPAPAGDDREEEFIELYNKSDFIIDLTNWLLQDPKTDYVFENTIIEPQEYLLLERTETKIALNNTGDEIKLYDSEDSLIDSLVYAKAVNNQSYVRDLASSSIWYWTDDITPGEANLNLSISSDPDVLGFSEEFVDNNFLQNINQIYNLELDTEVTVQGSVMALPGQIDRRMIYINDATGGVQVYLNNADWPELELGDIVEITGIVSQAYGEIRLKIKDINAISFITSVETAKPIIFCNVSEVNIGDYINLSGQIFKKSKPYLDLEVICDQNLKNQTIRARLDDDLFNHFNKEDNITVTGIIRSRNENIFIQVMDINNIEITQTDNINNETIENTYNKQEINVKPNQEVSHMITSTKNIIYAIILLIISLLAIYLKKKK